MKIFKSAIYDQFRCIASACPDSCCHEWSVSVDPDTAAFYRSLPGELGKRIRQVLAEEDGDTVMTIENDRCPMWRQDGLCRIQAELGHDALCQTCRDFPRLTHDYGDFQQWQLELSCPEAARLILNAPPLPPIVEQIPGGSEPDYDAQSMRLLLATLPQAFALLTQPRPMGHRLALLLMFGYHIQAQLDGGEETAFDPEAALAEAKEFAGQPDLTSLLQFYQGLEILTLRWQDRLNGPQPAQWEPRHAALACYFLERYWLQAVSDLDLVCRVKFAILSCLVIRGLGGDLVATAQLYSKEIENDPDNIETLLCGAYTCPAFTDARLLGLLLG